MELNRKLKNYKRLWFGMRSAPADLSTVKIYFFYGDNFDQSKYFVLNDARSIVNDPKFDKTKPTMLYLHGYVENMTVESIQVIADAYIQRNDHNTLILDWADLADGNYIFDAAPNTISLGAKLAEILIDLFSNGLDISKLHIIGHSLGGQLAGTIGRDIQTKSKQTLKLKRITCLDPAFPLFYPGIFKAVSANDAELVDVIHTDAWLYGAPSSTGTVDFWPNSGKTLQPGCPKRNYQMLTDNDLCSHRRSWRFWAESVANKNQRSFDAVKCKSWSDFKSGRITESTEPAYMGIDCSPGLRGDYYLQTNGEIPFSKGESGTKFEEIASDKT